MIFNFLKTKRCATTWSHTFLFVGFLASLLLQSCSTQNNETFSLQLDWRISLFEQNNKTAESIYPINVGKQSVVATLHPDKPTILYALHQNKIQWQHTDSTEDMYYNMKPLVAKNKIVIPFQNTTKCISTTGKTMWSIPFKGNAEPFLEPFSKPFSEKYALQTINDWEAALSKIYLINLSNGSPKLIYSRPWADSTKTIFRTPVKANNQTLLFTAITIQKNSRKTTAKWYLFDLKTATITHEGEAYRSNQNGHGVTKQPIVAGRYAFMIAYNEVFCLDLVQKKERWRTTLPRDMLTATPLIQNNQLFCPTEDGYIHCLDTDNGKLLWKAKAAGTPSRPIIIKNVLFVVGGADGVLYAFSTKDGTLLHTQKSPNHDYIPQQYFRRFIGTDTAQKRLLLFDGNSVRAYRLNF